MNTILWILQALLALVMLGAGGMKLARSKEELLATGNMDWTENTPESQIKGIGALEVLAAIGLTVPAIIDVVPVMTAVAASGVVALMIGAGVVHARRGEAQSLPVNVVIGGLALFVAIERFGAHAF